MTNAYGGGGYPGFDNNYDPARSQGHDYNLPGYADPSVQSYNPSSSMPNPSFPGAHTNLYETGGVMPASYNGLTHGYGVPSQVPLGYSQKNWLVAALLAFFLGTFGVHNFYLGYTRKATVQLVITLISYVTMIVLVGFIGLGVVALWAFVEFVMILVGAGSYDHDANGYPLER